ncbi:VanZ family protein [Cellulophaga baltica]|uniref:VanZ like family protein n=1 Tax=Cellulophaga baltica TaxID=76594 RepID=A0A1G7H6P6_9FLAO|nr:VanZ family protein [Cellulophaga baltica]SDE96045.1 VanZ like family protein [Cellulophaga baltica]
MQKKPEKYVQIIGFTLFALGIALIFLFSWKTNPNVGEYSFLPDWLINWADQYRNNRKRTGVPFIFLGFLAGAYLIYIKQKSLRFWILTGVILVLTVIIAELGQYFIPSRDPDPKDVLWGSIGAGIGLLPIFIFYKITTQLKK